MIDGLYYILGELEGVRDFASYISVVTGFTVLRSHLDPSITTHSDSRS